MDDTVKQEAPQRVSASGVAPEVDEPSTRAKAAAEEIYEIGKYDLDPEEAKAQIAAIIERCLSGGSALK